MNEINRLATIWKTEREKKIRRFNEGLPAPDYWLDINDEAKRTQRWGYWFISNELYRAPLRKGVRFIPEEFHKVLTADEVELVRRHKDE